MPAQEALATAEFHQALTPNCQAGDTETPLLPLSPRLRSPSAPVPSSVCPISHLSLMRRACVRLCQHLPVSPQINTRLPLCSSFSSPWTHRLPGASSQVALGKASHIHLQHRLLPLVLVKRCEHFKQSVLAQHTLLLCTNV